MFVISCSKSFIPQVLKVASSLGKKLIYFSSLGFVIWKNYDSKTSELKLHSFRAFQRYLTDNNLTRGGGTVSVFQFSSCSFLNDSVLLCGCEIKFE